MKHTKIYTIAALVCLLILWQAASFFLNIPILPSVYKTFMAFNVVYRDIGIHAAVSFLRVMAAIAVSLAIGLPLGICAGYSRRADAVISPIMYIFYPLPKIALLPVVMLFFGLGDSSKILIMVLIMLFQIAVTVRDGVKRIPACYYEPYRAGGINGLPILYHIVLPGATQDMFTALRTSFATAVSALFFSESYGTVYGMGYFVMDAWTRINYPQMYAGIISLGVMGFIIFVFLDGAERLVVRWK